MEKLNYNKILDLTLSVLLAETPNSHIEYNLLFKQNPSLNNLVNRDKRAVIEKLINDGYVNKMEVSIESLNNYYITLEGILFINSGGYISKQEKENRLKKWSKIKNTLLVVGTISAFVLALLQIYELGRGLLNNPDKTPKLECKSLQHNTQDLKQPSQQKNTMTK